MTRLSGSNMTRSIRPLTLLFTFTFLILFGSNPLLQAEPDFEIAEEIEYEIDEDDGRYTLEAEHKEYYRYLTKRSTEWTTFPVYERFYTEVSGLRGRYQGGKVDRDWITYDHAESADIFIANTKIWWIEFPTSEVGDEIMYSYDVEFDGAEWFPVHYISNMGNLRKFKVKINHPKEVKVEFSFFFPREEIPYRVEHPKDDVTLLIFENIEEQETLPFFPFNGSNAAVQTRLTVNGKAITPTRPEEFTAWYHGLFDQAPPVDASHQAKVDELVAAAVTDREKVEAIHDYVRENIRYIAEENDYGAIVPRDPNKVMSRGYGDCKDKAFLIANLARKHGLEVDMTLVATRPTPAFANATYVHQYNHAICSWDDGSGRIFFDPTSKYTEFGNLPDGDIESTALVLNRENPHMVTIPIPERSSGIEIDIRGNLEDPKKSQATITLRNGYNAAARYATNELHGVDRENFLSNMVTSHFYKMSLDYFDEDTLGHAHVTYRAMADLSDFMISSPTKRYIPAMPFSVYDAEILDRRDDPWPLYAGLNDPITMRLHLSTDGFSVEPSSVSIGEDTYGKVVSSIDITEDGTAIISYELNQASGEYRGEGKEGFLNFCRDYLKSRKEMFVLRKVGE